MGFVKITDEERAMIKLRLVLGMRPDVKVGQRVRASYPPFSLYIAGKVCAIHTHGDSLFIQINAGRKIFQKWGDGKFWFGFQEPIPCFMEQHRRRKHGTKNLVSRETSSK